MDTVSLKDGCVESLLSAGPACQKCEQSLRLCYEALQAYNLVNELQDGDGATEAAVREIGLYCTTGTQTLDALLRGDSVSLLQVVELQRALSALHTLLQARAAIELARVQWNGIEARDVPDLDIAASLKKVGASLEFSNRLLLAPRLRTVRDNFDKGTEATRKKLQEIVDQLPGVTTPVVDFAASLVGGFSAITGIDPAELFGSKQDR